MTGSEGTVQRFQIQADTFLISAVGVKQCVMLFDQGPLVRSTNGNHKTTIYLKFTAQGYRNKTRFHFLQALRMHTLTTFNGVIFFNVNLMVGDDWVLKCFKKNAHFRLIIQPAQNIKIIYHNILYCISVAPHQNYTDPP